MKRIMICIILIILITGCGLSEKKCGEITLGQAEAWKQIGYNYGISEGIDICKSD